MTTYFIRLIRLFLFPFIVIMLGALLLGCQANGSVENNEPKGSHLTSSQSSETVISSAVSTQKSVVQDSLSLPRMIDYGADKCVPCKAMAPILEELRTEYSGKVDVVFIDVWKNAEPGKQANVKLIPTQIFYAATGEELFRHEGFYSKDDILAKWKELGFQYE